MHAALAKLQADWMASRPFAEKLPGWLAPTHRLLEPTPADPAAAAVVVAGRADIDAHVNRAHDGTRTTFRQRRAVGEQLADYLKREVMPAQDEKKPSIYLEQVLKLRACRHGGAWGVDGGTGKLVIAWDSKCSLSLLCPHCARTEQRRLVRRYKEPLKAWKGQRHTRRIHSGVFTWPNVTPGNLAEYLRLIFKQFAKAARDFSSIKGYLATVEAPLSARGDWNLHINVLLCVDGPLDWGPLRAAWYTKTKRFFPGYEGTDFQVELRQLPRYDDDALDAALRELIKYPAKHVTEKSNGSGLAGRDRCGDAFSGAGEAVGRDEAGGAAGAHGRSGAPMVVVPRFAEVDGPGNADLVAGRGHRRGVEGNAGEAAGVDRGESGGGVCGMGQESSREGAGGSVGGGRREADSGGQRNGHGVPGCDGLAPAMIDWPPDRFLEWWEAHRRFRRTRSYGCLFGESLDELSGDVEDKPRGEVAWYGRLWWDGLAQAYAVSGAGPVGLIQANNSTAGADPPGLALLIKMSNRPPGLSSGPGGEHLSTRQ